MPPFFLPGGETTASGRRAKSEPIRRLQTRDLFVIRRKKERRRSRAPNKGVHLAAASSTPFILLSVFCGGEGNSRTPKGKARFLLLPLQGIREVSDLGSCVEADFMRSILETYKNSSRNLCPSLFGTVKIVRPRFGLVILIYLLFPLRSSTKAATDLDCFRARTSLLSPVVVSPRILERGPDITLRSS